MAGNYSYQGADFDNLFLKDYNVLDQTVGAGSLLVWGSNNSGVLGTNNTTKYSSPVQTVAGGTTWKQIAIGAFSMGGIKSDNTLWMWGQGNSGQLGDGTYADKSSPVQVSGTTWKEVSCGGAVTGAIKTDGTLWMWGSNFYYGALGTGNNTGSNSPVQTISAGNNWKQLSVGGNSVGAIKTDGTLWVWGRNQFGQLGLNDTTPRSSPTQTVAGGTNWKQVSVAPLIAGAIKTDGTLWMLGGWGDYGGMGDGTSVSKSSPVQTIAGGTNWKQVAAQSISCAAIKTDGTLWLWGFGELGQLGNNAIVSKSSPVQTIAGGTNWKQVYTVTGNWACATKTDGTLWTWGANGYGQLGDNSTTARSSPVQTSTGGTNWKLAAGGGGDNAAAIHFFDSLDSYPNS